MSNGLKQSKIKYSSNYIPKTLHQEEYVNYLNNIETKIIVSIGPAGCGKTLFACEKAIQLLKTSQMNKIIITRPVVSVDEEIGFLPGNIIKKMDPWTKPIFDIFLEHYSKSELDLMLYNGKIEICPLAFMRGRTFKHSFIIADEMQNSSPNQMKMLTTRIGDGSKMVITGDLHQTDIQQENGLQEFVEKLHLFNDTSDMIHLSILDSTDIERSDVVKKVLDIYEYKHQISKNETTTNTTTTTNTNTNTTTNKKPNSNSNSDAALIPVHHATKFYDIFMERPEY
jgi:phosphate starvation-inducible PhoH-like protein